MRKSCVVCGGQFEAKRAVAKYCGEVCRKRAQRRPGGVEGLNAEAVPVDEEREETGGLTTATTAELERVNRVDTALGQAALVLARRIDAGGAETGSSLASMVREHRATLAEALRDSDEQADPLDELRKHRERKLAGG